jgi:hypothetical protein
MTEVLCAPVWLLWLKLGTMGETYAYLSDHRNINFLNFKSVNVFSVEYALLIKTERIGDMWKPKIYFSSFYV